jgi:hypothetical protein
MITSDPHKGPVQYLTLTQGTAAAAQDGRISLSPNVQPSAGTNIYSITTKLFELNQFEWPLMPYAGSFALVPTSPEQPQQKASVGSEGTGLDDAVVARRAYPHIVEAAEPAIALISRALDDARLALDAFSDNDFNEVANRLSVIAAQCKEAHPLTKFNECFGSIVPYIRRAALVANPDELTRESLNALVQAMSRLVDNSMVSLSEAGKIRGELSESGWNGENRAVERLFALLLGTEHADSPVRADAQG